MFGEMGYSYRRERQNNHQRMLKYLNYPLNTIERRIQYRVIDNVIIFEVIGLNKDR